MTVPVQNANSLVVINSNGAHVSRKMLAAIAAGQRLSGIKGGTVDVLLMGDESPGLKHTLGTFVSRLLVIGKTGMNALLPEVLLPLLADVVSSGEYGFVVAPAATVEHELLCALSASSGAGKVADVVDIDIEGAVPHYERLVFAGNIRTRLTISTPMHLLTVQSLEGGPVTGGSGASVVEVGTDMLDISGFKGKVLDTTTVSTSRPSLADAKVVVAGGAAFKTSEEFALVEKLADRLGGAVGGSRAAVDAGFLPNEFQVGQTGKIVSPELYIAVGISGALQHVAGMRSSGVIIAINKDPEAPIFRVADYGMVGDFRNILPMLIEQL